jgi:hypothetical protein
MRSIAGRTNNKYRNFQSDRHIYSYHTRDTWINNHVFEIYFLFKVFLLNDLLIFERIKLQLWYGGIFVSEPLYVSQHSQIFVHFSYVFTIEYDEDIQETHKSYTKHSWMASNVSVHCKTRTQFDHALVMFKKISETLNVSDHYYDGS